MDATLRSLVENESLGLRVLAGKDQLETGISWVATSEHADPTRYLDGGELLLTTGMRFDASEDFSGYVQLLEKVGVVAIGFGLGPVHDAVPDNLVATCRRLGLVLLEIAPVTPFIAITKAVADIVAERYLATETRESRIREILTRAVQRSGADALIAELAESINGWAALLSPAGVVRTVAPSTATNRLGDVSDALRRTRNSVSFASAALIDNGERIEILPIGDKLRHRGILVVGGLVEERGRRNRTGTIAAEILGLELELEATRASADRRRLDLLVMLLDNNDLRSNQLAVLFGGRFVAGRIAVAVIHVPKSEIDDIRMDVEAYHPGVVVAQYKSRLAVFMRETDLDSDAIERALGNVSRYSVGISVARGIDEAKDALKQADRAATAAVETGLRVFKLGGEVRPTYSTMLITSDDGEIAASLFAPIETADGVRAGDLCRTLIAWLGLNGHVETAANFLGVHRHTLRARMRRIERLLGGTLTEATSRAELWFAALQRYPQLSAQVTESVRSYPNGTCR